MAKLKDVFRDLLQVKYIPYFLFFGVIIFTCLFPRFVRENEMLLTIVAVPLIVLSYFFCTPRKEQ